MYPVPLKTLLLERAYNSVIKRLISSFVCIWHVISNSVKLHGRILIQSFSTKQYRKCPRVATITDHSLPMTSRSRANKPWQTVHKPHRTTVQYVQEEPQSKMTPGGFVCLFYSGFTSLSTIFQSYRDGVWMWQGAQCSLVECCLTEISRPRHLTWYSTQPHYTDTKLTSSDS